MRSAGNPSNGQSGQPALPVEDPYERARSSRLAYIRELLAALKSATEKSDRKVVESISLDLVREGKESVAPSLEALKATANWNYRNALLSVLGKIRHPDAIKALEEFYGTLRSNEGAPKIEVVRLLGRLASGLGRQALLRLLERESDPPVREEIAKILVAIGLRPEELGVLKKEERALVEKGVQGEGVLRTKLDRIAKLDPKSDATLTELTPVALGEQTTAVALAAFRKLEERDDGKAAQLLAQRVQSKPDTDAGQIIQTNALASLCRMKAAEARLCVREFVLAQEPEIRHQAISLLGSYGDAAMIPLLEQVGREAAGEDTRKWAQEAAVLVRVREAKVPPSEK